MKELITLTQSTRDCLFMDLTVKENSILYAKRLNLPQKGRKLSQFLQQHIAGFSKKVAQLFNQPAYQLSGGEQQILILALAMIEPPKLLLLDEHTSALDPKTAEFLMKKTVQAITERGITCMMTTHHLDHALHFGNRILALHEGQISFQTEGEEKQQIKRETLLSCCYG